MPSLLHGPQGTLRNGWKILLFVLLASFADRLALGLRDALAGDGGLPVWMPAPWFAFLGALGVTWLFLYVEGQPLASVGLQLGWDWFRDALGGALLGLALIALTALVGHLAGGYRLVHGHGAQAQRLATGAWFYLGVAAGEELLFRGYLFQRLERGIGAGGAQAVLAVLFALVHWSNPGLEGPARAWASVNIALASLLLGLAYLRTRSLAAPIGLHLGWNWAQGSLLGFRVSGLPSTGWWTPAFHHAAPWITGGAFGLEASLPCTVVTAAACAFLARGLPDPARPERDDLF